MRDTFGIANCQAMPAAFHRHILSRVMAREDHSQRSEAEDGAPISTRRCWCAKANQHQAPWVPNVEWLLQMGATPLPLRGSSRPPDKLAHDRRGNICAAEGKSLWLRSSKEYIASTHRPTQRAHTHTHTSTPQAHKHTSNTFPRRCLQKRAKTSQRQWMDFAEKRLKCREYTHGNMLSGVK